MKKMHWENVYQTKSPDSVSWYRAHTDLSLAWIANADLVRDSAIIDVGASTLVDDLLAAGYTNLAVLDISGAALEAAQQRLGKNAEQIIWYEADITTVEFTEQVFDVWHDRAVFHFLTEAVDRDAYLDQLYRVVKVEGHLIMATFNLAGPARCSGLPIVQYSADTLQRTLGTHFRLIEYTNERHVTPSSGEQQFIYCHFIKQ